MEEEKKKKVRFIEALSDNLFKYKRKEEKEEEALIGPDDTYFWERK